MTDNEPIEPIVTTEDEKHTSNEKIEDADEAEEPKKEVPTEDTMPKEPLSKAKEEEATPKDEEEDAGGAIKEDGEGEDGDEDVTMTFPQRVS
jgi:hypothetical protein